MNKESLGDITLQQSTLNPHQQAPQAVMRLKTSNAQWTLGAYIAPDGSGKKQLEILKDNKTLHA